MNTSESICKLLLYPDRISHLLEHCSSMESAALPPASEVVSNGQTLNYQWDKTIEVTEDVGPDDYNEVERTYDEFEFEYSFEKQQDIDSAHLVNALEKLTASETKYNNDLQKLAMCLENNDALATLDSSSPHRPCCFLFEQSTKNVGLSYLAPQRENFIHRNGGHFSLMVTGGFNCGKTSFINTLFNSYLAPVEFLSSINSNDDSSLGLTNPLTSLKFLNFELIEDGVPLELNVIETPGFGESIDNQCSWIPLINYIEQQFNFYAFQEEQPERKQLVDSRVHVCIYVIYPSNHALLPLDIISMKELNEKINLIPVIGKSDCLTNEELINFKKIIKNQLIENNIEIGKFILDQSLKSKLNSQIPYAIINSNEKNQLIRKYDYGIIEIENSDHCDFASLRDLLITENMLDFIESTEYYYESHRSNCFNNRLKILNLSINDNEDGLHQYLKYHQLNYQSYQRKINEVDPILDLKQKQLKDVFAIVVSKQENRFKEWKKALIEKQDELNADIAKLHTKLIGLKEIIYLLESGTPADEIDSNRTSLAQYYTDDSINDDESFRGISSSKSETHFFSFQ